MPAVAPGPRPAIVRSRRTSARWTLDEILASAIDLPITSWNYIAEGKKIRHLGPVSQDFWAAFGLGADDKSITSIDETGMALVAIQGLNAKLEERLAEKERQISAHEHEIEELRSELAGLRDMVAGAIRRSTGAAGTDRFRAVCMSASGSQPVTQERLLTAMTCQSRSSLSLKRATQLLDLTRPCAARYLGFNWYRRAFGVDFGRVRGRGYGTFRIHR